MGVVVGFVAVLALLPGLESEPVTSGRRAGLLVLHEGLGSAGRERCRLRSSATGRDGPGHRRSIDRLVHEPAREARWRAVI